MKALPRLALLVLAGSVAAESTETPPKKKPATIPVHVFVASGGG